MTKVIKEEFEKLESLKISDDSFACNTSLEIFHEEFNWMSRMDDDLLTYEVEISRLANISCDLNEEDDSEQQMTHGSGDDLEYDPSDARGDDEVELTYEESSDSDDEDEVAEIFRIDTNVFDFETPMCRAFKEFNYLLQIDPDVLTKNTEGFKTYNDYKDGWIYEWNEDVPWAHERPWTDNECIKIRFRIIFIYTTRRDQQVVSDTEEEVPTNFALMAFLDSEVHNNKTCSKTCLKSFEDLKSQYDNLRIELNKSQFDLANYKRGLASVEEQLVFYKKNEGMLCDQIAVLKRDASFNESEINALKIQIERLKKEKESNQIKIDNFENASKSLDKLIGCQISDNNRKGVGYNAVAPPLTGLFAPPTIDLSNSGLEEFKQPEFGGYGVKVNKSVSENSSNEIKKTSGAPIIEDWVSNCNEDETLEKVRNFAPTAVLTKSGLVPISTARQSSSRAAAPVSTARPIKTAAPKPFVNVVKSRPNAFQKSHSPSRRSFYQHTALKNRNLNNRVNTVKVNSVNTAKVNGVTSVVGEQGINVVKSTACWVWRPKIKVLDHVSKNNGSYICKQFDYVDPTGRIKSVMAWVGDEAVHKELGDRMERAATTASSFKAEQDSDSGPRGYTLGSGEDSMQQMELMEFVQNCVNCTARLILFSTASATPEVSTAAEGLVYIRRSAKKKKDKGKAIMIEDESVQKKSKKQMQKERLGHEKDIRLQEQIDEGERKRIARDAEIAKLLKICLRILTGMI
ncbi:hypothetical protein Tco_0053840 [Tanacetum coccineum]